MFTSVYTKRLRRKQAGFTLLISVLIAGIVLAIGVAILNITLKELILSSVARESQAAFAAADVGMECAFYWDAVGRAFDIDAPASNISCGGGNVLDGISGSPTTVGGVATGTDNVFWIQWGSPEICTEVTVTKHDNTTLGSCPVGVVCTRVIARGYNNCDLTNPRTVERALRTRY